METDGGLLGHETGGLLQSRASRRVVASQSGGWDRKSQEDPGKAVAAQTKSAVDVRSVETGV